MTLSSYAFTSGQILLMICGTIIIVLVYFLVKGVKQSTEYLPKNDPQEEEINQLAYWIFRHGKVFSGRFFTEATAKEFASKHSKWLVGYWYPELNKSPYDINYEKRGTIWKEFNKDDEEQNCPYSS